MIEAARLTRIKELLLSSFILNINPSFFYIYIWSSVFSHGSKFYNVTFRTEIMYTLEDMERRHEIVLNGQGARATIHHGVGSRRLLRIVDNGIRLEVGKNI